MSEHGVDTYICTSISPHVFTQSEVYSDLGQPLLEKALEGYNATIFAYGQVSNVHIADRCRCPFTCQIPCLC